MCELIFWNKSDFNLKNSQFDLLLVCFFVDIGSDKSLILKIMVCFSACQHWV